MTAAALSFVAAPAAGAASAAAEGECTDTVGVTVVIDFHELGGGVHVVCAPGPVSTGLDALDQADVAYQTTLRSPGFVCKIAGLPEDDPCVDTSPATAYWSYWVAPRGGEWCYSNFGPGSRQPPPGTVEGWSFARDRTAATTPPPGIPSPAAIPGTTPTPLGGSDCAAAGPTGPPALAPPDTTVPAPVPTAATTTAPTSAVAAPGPEPTAPPEDTVPEETAPPTDPPPSESDELAASEGAVGAESTSPLATTSTAAPPSTAAVTSAPAATATAVSTTPSTTARAPTTAGRAASTTAASGALAASPVDLGDDGGGGAFPIVGLLVLVLVAALAAGAFVLARRRTAPLDH